MDTPISGLDIFIAIVLAFCTWRGYRRGLIRAVFDLLSNVVALALTYMFSGVVASALRQTALFDWLKAAIAGWLGLSDRVSTGVTNIIAQADVIAGLSLPNHVLNLLLENNNPEVYNMLGVTLLEDYISGFLASMIISAISAAAVFMVTFSVLMFISRSLRIFNRIPIIGRLNRLGGAVGGAAIGTFMIWVIFAVMTLVPMDDIGISDTVIARYFYENNMLMDFFVNITSRL